MTTLGLLTVCIASSSCRNLCVDYDHNRLDDARTGELKVLINIWYKMDSRVRQKAPQELLEVGRSKRTETKSQS